MSGIHNAVSNGVTKASTFIHVRPVSSYNDNSWPSLRIHPLIPRTGHRLNMRQLHRRRRHGGTQFLAVVVIVRRVLLLCSALSHDLEVLVKAAFVDRFRSACI